ncbi:MAG: hypothetical protein Kow0080_10440 [Candidatus Promineifilaceae bacterium]
MLAMFTAATKIGGDVPVVGFVEPVHSVWGKRRVVRFVLAAQTKGVSVLNLDKMSLNSCPAA